MFCQLTFINILQTTFCAVTQGIAERLDIYADMNMLFYSLVPTWV